MRNVTLKLKSACFYICKTGLFLMMLCFMFLLEASPSPIVDDTIYTGPEGISPDSAIGGPTQEGELTILREKYFLENEIDMTGSGLTLDGSDSRLDGNYSQSIFFRTGPVVDSSSDPEVEGTITFPPYITVIGMVISTETLEATDSTWGLHPQIDYTASARLIENSDTVTMEVNENGETVLYLFTNIISTPYTDEIRVLIDYGDYIPANAYIDVDLTKGSDINVGDSDGGGTTTRRVSLTSDISCEDDSDGDGIDDCTERDDDTDTADSPNDIADDTDGDGIPSYFDEDSDGDGKLDADEGRGDDDYDGIPNYLDEDDEDGLSADPDGDGLTTGEEISIGTDPLNDDSDGDGLSDGVEVGDDKENPRNTDGDELIDALDDDDDNDTIPTATEIADAGGNSDYDNDGNDNWYDTDADGDGKPDKEEGRGDIDGDGNLNYIDDDEGDDSDDTEVNDDDSLLDPNGDEDGDGKPDKDTDDENPNYTVRGGACSIAVIDNNSDYGMLLLIISAVLMVMLFFVRSKSVKKNSIILLILLLPVIGRAGETVLDAQSFKPSPFKNSLFTIHGADFLKPYDYRLGFFLHYQHNPLTLRDDAGEKVIRTVLGPQLTGDLTGSIGILDWLDVGMALPLIFYQDGEGWQDGDDHSVVGIGDIRLLPRVRIFKLPANLVAIAFIPEVTFPTGHLIDPLNGSASLTFRPTISVMSDLVFMRGALDLFYTMVKNETVADLNVYDDIGFKLGAEVPLPEKVSIIAELSGKTTVTDPFGKINESALEIIGGATYELPHDLTVSCGGGTGLTSGYNMPLFRMFVALTYQPQEKKTPGPKDTDGDGLEDSIDNCPTEPEDMDDFEDEDGCPDPDNDKDGVLDVDDKCPMEPEDKDGFEDEDGCPDPDNDKDGVLDVDDKCPKEPEDMDGFEDEDGCPDPDNDQDSVLDVDDNCPNEPEDIDGYEDDDGCPEENPEVKQIVVTKKDIQIKDRIYFRTGKATLLSRSYGILDEIVTVLMINESNELIIKGHTDNRGGRKYNQRLSERRAQAVRRYLIEQGIPEERLTSKGYGETKPIATNRTKEGRRKNRRVEFEIVQ